MNRTAELIASRAAGYRANAEAFLELAALRNKPQYIEQAYRQYQLARDEEGGEA